MFNAETSQPVVNAVSGAVNVAVDRAASAAVRGAVYRSVGWDVDRAASAAVRGAVGDAVYDPGQPTLRDFLQEAK